MKQIEPQALYEPLRGDRLRYSLMLTALQAANITKEVYVSDDGNCYALVAKDKLFTWAHFSDYNPVFFAEILARYPSLEISVYMPPDAELDFAYMPGVEAHFPPHEDFAHTGALPDISIDPRIRVLKVEEYDLLPGGLPSHARAREATLSAPGFRAFALFEGEQIIGFFSGSPMTEDLWCPSMCNCSDDEELYRKLYEAFLHSVRGQGAILMDYHPEELDPDEIAWKRGLGFEPSGVRFRFSWGPATMKELDPQMWYHHLRRDRLRFAGMLLEMQRKRFKLEAFDYNGCFCLVTHYSYGPYAMFTEYSPDFVEKLCARYPSLSMGFYLPPDAELEVAPLPGLTFKGLYIDYACDGEISNEATDPRVRLLGVEEYGLVKNIVRNEPELKEPGARIFAWIEDGKAMGYLSCSPFIEDLWDMDMEVPNAEIAAELFKAYAQTIRAQGSTPVCSGGEDEEALRMAGFSPRCARLCYEYLKPEPYYTTEMGPRLTQWVTEKIKRDYPDDVALLVGVPHCSVNGDGHGECFDYFVPATERGYALERSIVIGGVHHDLYSRDWARCERTANLEDWATFCLADGVILYSRSGEDTERFEALRQRLKVNHLADPEFVCRKALERLDEAMNLYRTMMFEEKPHQVRMAAGYAFDHLLCAALYLNGQYKGPYHRNGQLAELAKCAKKPEHFEAYYRAMLGAKTAGELKSIAHLMIQTTRKFIAACKPPQAEPEYSTNLEWLAAWYAEMSLTWRRLRFFCEEGNADSALTDACTLQNECNAMGDEYGLPEMDILSAFDSENLRELSEQASDAERRVGEWIAERAPLVPNYATFEEFAECNP